MPALNSSNLVHRPPQHQVFINFRGAELRLSFISHLHSAFERKRINSFIDKNEKPGKELDIFFQRIEESRIAIAVISSKYTESDWCLDELAKIKECVEKEKLEVIPVFYKVDPDAVSAQSGSFGDHFRKLVERFPHKAEIWDKALKFVTARIGKTVDEKSEEGPVIENIVKEVLEMLDEIAEEGTESQGGRRQAELVIENRAEDMTCLDASSLYGIETRTKQLEEKLEIKSRDVTRIVSVVGMPGIGKTALAKKVLENQRSNFTYSMFLDEISRKSKVFPLNRLHEDLLFGLSNGKNNKSGQQGINFSLETFKASLSKSKIFVVLDDVSEKKQLDAILGEMEWIREGSKIVIITRSESAVKGIVNDSYFVPGLSHSEALRHFNFHAFSNADYRGDPSLMKLAKEFVDYSGGHPLALKVLGSELRLKEKAYWESKCGMLTKGLSNTIQDVLRIPYDELSEHHKNAFLDIACFFRFDDEYHVRSLLDSSPHDDIRVLADKFLINICAGRLEMNDLLYTFAMGLVSQSSPENTRSGCRLFNHGEIVGVLTTKAEETKVRGIFFDVSQVTSSVTFDSDTFARMDHLRYLKFFNSRCPKECESDCTVKFPDGVDFTLQEIRYLHWLKFESRKFPQKFDPRNLIDLQLPYSEIEQIWDGEKDAPKLKWLDLNHSCKLRTLSGLSQARNLHTLNLEGCTELKTVHNEVQNMDSLVLLNLRGCTSLESFPEMNLISLKTLILTGCSSFQEFHMVGKNLKELYLDGTAITGLPSTIGDLESLILLKLKDCKYLSSLPDTIGNLISLRELILSGCSRLANFPKLKQKMKHLKILLLDGTAISFSHLRNISCEWPNVFFQLSSVRRLCLRRNNFESLPSNISSLYHLRWLDLKYCKKLVSVPMLPPNLEWLDAHGCVSLEKMADPLPIRLAETKHIHSTFIFSNCTKLDQVAENSIVSYVRRKIQLMSNALARYDEGFVLDVLIGICFPGWQVPVWFNHRKVGSVLKPELPRHWSDGGLTGIALCAVVSFANYQAQNSRFFVRSTCEFTEKDGSCIRFSCILGGCTENGSDEPREIESGHVFIGYTSWLHIKKCDGEVTSRNGCVPTEATVKFEVTDGTRQVTNCEVLKCGFSLIYAPTKIDYSFCTEDYSGVAPATNNLPHGEGTSDSTIDTRGNIQTEERYYQNGSGASSVSLGAPRVSRVFREEVKPDASNNAGPSRSKDEMEHNESSSSRMDPNLKSESTRKNAEKRKPMGVDDSTGEVAVRGEANNTTCLSFLHGIFQCMGR